MPIVTICHGLLLNYQPSTQSSAFPASILRLLPWTMGHDQLTFTIDHQLNLTIDYDCLFHRSISPSSIVTTTCALLPFFLINIACSLFFTMTGYTLCMFSYVQRRSARTMGQQRLVPLTLISLLHRTELDTTDAMMSFPIGMINNDLSGSLAGAHDGKIYAIEFRWLFSLYLSAKAHNSIGESYYSSMVASVTI